MSRRLIGSAAVLAAATLLIAACGTGVDISQGDPVEAPVEGEVAPTDELGLTPLDAMPISRDGSVCVILPDAASSARWETADRPYLEAAFTELGLAYDIQNANGDKTKFATIADGMLTAGCSVMLIVNLDSPTAAAVIEKATLQGVSVIDYDRLTLGGGANYYVSFDNVAVGRTIGEGLIKCMEDNGDKSGPVALLNGSPTDNNATLFKEGYETALTDAGYTVGADQDVPDWDNTKAGTIFEQMYADANGDFVGVAAANDGLAGAVNSVLDRNGQAGTIPVTGQDATDEGLQRVLLGTQCMSVYKAIKAEADAAALLASHLVIGDTIASDEMASDITIDSETGGEVYSVLLEPVAVFADNVKDVVADGYTTVERLCTTEELKAACAEHGVM